MKTAEELGITQVIYDGLVRVRELLPQLQLIEYEYRLGDEDIEGSESEPTAFNMAHWCTTGSCGTIACIGGWVESLMKTKINTLKSPDGLDQLFFPNPINKNVDCAKITPEQAVKAITNYLEKGEPDWEMVL